jgi:hypothetical protein
MMGAGARGVIDANAGAFFPCMGYNTSNGTCGTGWVGTGCPTG